jgi:ABC-type branched-subunit amino acid transport system substrate-binding protein
MSRRTAGRRAMLLSVTGATALALTLAACGRSSQTPTAAAPAGSTPATAAPSATASASAAGDFGDLKGICGPGDAKGATARGVTDTEIHVGTSADPGAAAAPGLEQEFFDAGDAFSKWCNAAGGINGRKIVLTKYDAKLFEGAAQIINACRSEFMLVGNGNALDGPMQKPRLACKLGQFASYVVSPEAVGSDLTITAQSGNSNEYPIGGIRLLTDAFPATKAAVGIGSSALASITPQGKRAQEAALALGIKVPVLTEKPALVDNYRPYMEQMKAAGVKGYLEIVAQDPAPEVQAMDNVGWTPDWVLWGTQFYSDKSVQAAKSIKFPNSYVYTLHLPWDLASKYPVLQQIQSILKASISKPQYTAFTADAFNSWALWAKSASECGSTLTQDCVFQKAKANKTWTAGGLFPTRDMGAAEHVTECFVMEKLTPDGFKFDADVTKPNTDGVYNCSPKNVGHVKTYQS